VGVFLFQNCIKFVFVTRAAKEKAKAKDAAKKAQKVAVF